MQHDRPSAAGGVTRVAVLGTGIMGSAMARNLPKPWRPGTDAKTLAPRAWRLAL